MIADTARARHAVAARVPRRLCRGREIRPARRRGLLRLAGSQSRRHVRRRCGARARDRDHLPRQGAIVARDERETGERALLNLGHTFGHALEAATGFSDRLFHGEGVAIGMVLAAEFSARLGLIAAGGCRARRAPLAAVGLPTRLQDIAGFAQEGLADADALMALMAQDKKVKRGKLTFILLRGIGRAVIAQRRRAGAGARFPESQAGREAERCIG